MFLSSLSPRHLCGEPNRTAVKSVWKPRHRTGLLLSLCCSCCCCCSLSCNSYFLMGFSTGVFFFFLKYLIKIRIQVVVRLLVSHSALMTWFKDYAQCLLFFINQIKEDIYYFFLEQHVTAWRFRWPTFLTFPSQRFTLTRAGAKTQDAPWRFFLRGATSKTGVTH